MEYKLSFISLLNTWPSDSNTDYRHFAKLWTLAATNMKVSLLYFILTVLVILDAVGYVIYQTSLVGYWSDKILVWIWILFTIIFSVRNFKQKFVKVYTLALGLVIVLSFIPFGLLFIGFYSFLTARDRPFSYQVTNSLRVQEILRSPMAASSIEIVQEKVFLEKVIAIIPREIAIANKSYFITEADKIEISLLSQDSTTLQLHFKNGEIISQKVKLGGFVP